MNEYEVFIRVTVSAESYKDAHSEIERYLPPADDKVTKWMIVTSQTKKISSPDLLYRCPSCRRILSEREFEEETEAGRLPYCDCEFTSESRTYIEYEVYQRMTKCP